MARMNAEEGVMQLDPGTLEIMQRQRREAFDAEVDQILRARVAAAHQATSRTQPTSFEANRVSDRIRSVLGQAVAALATLASIG
jgi:hypothetical protein